MSIEKLIFNIRRYSEFRGRIMTVRAAADATMHRILRRGREREREQKGDESPALSSLLAFRIENHGSSNSDVKRHADARGGRVFGR